MRVVALDRHGPPDVLVPATRPVPAPAAGQFLVRVAACGVCGHDLLARRGDLAAAPGAVLGHEIAGRVERLGAGVDAGWLGARVALVQRIPCGECADCAAGATNLCRRGPGFYGEDLPGGYAEFVVATPSNAVVLPDTVDDVTGAILSCAVGTGLHALRGAAVRPGDLVAVTGAGGGVGLHTVQVATALGATVIAVTGSPAKATDLRTAGAAEVVAAADGYRGVRSAAAALGHERGVDVVVETTGAPTFELGLRALAPRGRLMLVGNTAPADLRVPPGLAILRELTVRGSAHATRPELEEVVDMVSSATISPVAAAVFPLAEAPRAHAAVEARTVAGRAVLTP